MAELERADAVMRQMLAEIAPFLEQRDGRALVVLKGQHLADAGDRVVAQFALDAVLFEFAGELVKVGIGRDFERQHGAAFGVGFVELDGEQADLGGEEGAVLFALGDDEAQNLGVIVDHPVEIGRVVGRVSDAVWLDHDLALPAWRFLMAGINHRASVNSRPERRARATCAMRKKHCWACQARGIAVCSAAQNRSG